MKELSRRNFLASSAAALAYVSYRNMDAFERKELLRALEQSGGPKADHDALRAVTLEGSRQSAVKSYDPNNPG